MLDDDTEWTSVEAQMDDAEQSASDRGTERKEHSGSDVISELIDVDDLLDVDPDQVKSSLRAMISFFTVIKMDAGAEDIEAFECREAIPPKRCSCGSPMGQPGCLRSWMSTW